MSCCASSISFCRTSPTSGPGWMMLFSCASCGPGSLTTTVPYSCCSITMRAVRLGQRSSKSWSHQLSNMSWIWAFLQCCHSRIRMADTSFACVRVILSFWPNRDCIVIFFYILIHHHLLCFEVIFSLSLCSANISNSQLPKILNFFFVLFCFVHPGLFLQENGSLMIIHLWTM